MKIKTTNSRNNTLLSSSASAQVSVNLNIGTESSWHPYESWENNGYSNTYYLPDIECYYDVRRQQFIFFDGRS
jgi:hypothetical protein